MHIPPVPFAAIAQLFSVYKGTIHKHWQNFKAQENVLPMRGCPVGLMTGEINETVDVTLNTQITSRPLSGPEVRGIIEKKYQKTVVLDTLYQILRRNGRICLCTAIPMEVSLKEKPIDHSLLVFHPSVKSLNVQTPDCFHRSLLCRGEARAASSGAGKGHSIGRLAMHEALFGSRWTWPRP
jgi:hypothetical protein